MFCEKCGSKLEEGAKFCTSCGNPVNMEVLRQAAVQIPVQKQVAAQEQIPVQEQVAAQEQIPVQEQVSIQGQASAQGQMEEKITAIPVEPEEPKIRNTDEVHFIDRLYDGNIILKSTNPFTNVEQQRYIWGLIPMLIVLILSALEGDIVDGFIGAAVIGWIYMIFARGVLVKWKDVPHYSDIEFYLPYQMQGNELENVVKKVLGTECENIESSETSVKLWYENLWFELYIRGGNRIVVDWYPGDFEELRWDWILRFMGGWRARYVYKAVASISYIIYKLQQELFRTDAESRKYYTGIPAVYQKVKPTIPNIIFKIILGIGILMAWSTGESE